ncbi:MAG: molybdopterin-binding protein [Syntrophomonadaceae bacterium]
MVRLLPVQEAVGLALCHDLTRIVPGEFKGAAFKRGHIIHSDDIPILLDMGKEHIYVVDTMDMVHEDEAAQRLARAAAGDGLVFDNPSEGKVTMRSDKLGLLKVNTKALLEVNSIEQVIFSTLHNNQIVSSGKIVAATRVVPLFVQEETIKAADQVCRSNYPLITISRLRSMKVGIVTTGSEVYSKRISDGFGPVISRKLDVLGSQILSQIIVNDEKGMISQAIKKLIGDGAEMIMVTGGMSVDPDDQTPSGIKEAGGQIISYGAPVLPGSMFLLAYLDGIPVLGLPACIIHSPATVLDLLLPRLLAGERLERKDIIELGHGGLCCNCRQCSFPECGFGKCGY